MSLKKPEIKGVAGWSVAIGMFVIMTASVSLLAPWWLVAGALASGVLSRKD
jgi:hypothetical protein